MDTNRLPKQALKYKPNGRRKTRHQRKYRKTNFTMGLRTGTTFHQVHDDDDDGSEHNVVEHLWILRKLAHRRP
jgi:hypothetical protein